MNKITTLIFKFFFYTFFLSFLSTSLLFAQLSSGDCFSNHGGLGCSDACCEAVVCGVDAFCCNTQWDGICAGEAADLCNFETLPSTYESTINVSSNCLISNGGTGCEDSDCEAIVCGVDAFCCNNAWDGICAGEAADLCDLPPPCDIKVSVEQVASVCEDDTYNIFSVEVKSDCGNEPYTYDLSSVGGFATISEKGLGLLQVIGGPTTLWSLIITDAEGNTFTLDPASDAGDDNMNIPFITALSSTNESAVGAEDGTATVEVTGGCSNNVYDIEWSDGQTTATATDLASGTYSVTVTDCCGQSACGSVYVGRDRRRGRGKTNLDVSSFNESINIAPNPFNTQTTISIGIAESENAVLNIYALDGRIVQELFSGRMEAENTYQLNVNAALLPNGTYIARLVTESGLILQEKMVVLK